MSLLFQITSITQVPRQNIYEVELTAEKISAFVWLDAHELNGKFSENGFLMVRPKMTIYFYPKQKYSLSEVEKNIDVTHSHDIL